VSHKLAAGHKEGGMTFALRLRHNVFRCHFHENRDFNATHHFTFGVDVPTPTLTLPLKGREIAMFLPLQGGGLEGDGVSLDRPLCPAPPFMGKDQFAKGG